MKVHPRTLALCCSSMVVAVGIALITGCGPDSPTPTGVVASPRYQVGSLSAGTFAYVASVNSGSISVIQTTDHTVVATIAVGGIPGGVAAAADGAFAYVTDRAGRIWEIETASNTLVRTIPVPSGDVDDIAIRPDGQLAYVNQRNNGMISVVDINTGSVVATVAVGQLPSRIAFSPSGASAYVVNFLSNSVSVIETAAHTVVRTIPVGTFPNDIAIASDGARAYVANWASNSVSVIDVAAGAVVQSIPVTGAFTLELSPDNAELFVASWSTAFKGVTRIATATNAVVASFPVAVEQANIKLTPDGAYAYLTDFSGSLGPGHSVVVVDTRSNATVAMTDVGQAPFGMAMITTGPSNNSPTAAAGGAYSANEGATIAFDGSGSSDPDGDPLTFNWDFGDGSDHATGATPSHAYGDDGRYTVTLTVSDGNGGTATATTTATITNVAPAVHTGGKAYLLVGEAFVRAGSFTDPGAGDTWTADVSFGDGVGAQPLVLADQNFELRHTYGSSGTRTVLVRVTDDDAGVGTASFEVVVETLAEAGRTHVLAEVAVIRALGREYGDVAALLRTALQSLNRGDVEQGIELLRAYLDVINRLASEGRIAPDVALVITTWWNRVIASYASVDGT